MLEALGIALFAALIGLSIALHELGHLIPAKRFGVKVPEYMIGFGPTVWSWKGRETTYGVKALPLGGYIRMIGMLPPGPDGTAPTMTTGRFATMIANARQASMEEISPGDEQRTFYRLPVRRRLVIMLGGPLMNLLLTFVLFAIALVGIGLPTASLTVDAVVPCISAASSTKEVASEGSCQPGEQVSPAAAAGLLPGDVIVALDGTPVDSWEQAAATIASNPGAVMPVTVLRDGETLVLPLRVGSVPGADPTAPPRGFMGVSPSVAYERQPWSAVPSIVWDMSVASVRALVALPVRLYTLVSDTLLGGGERDAEGPVSVVGVSRLGGEIAARDMPVQSKVLTFLSLAASLNLFLFLFNLLPVLPLDGGHAAAATYEGVRRRWSRWRNKPDPGPVDTARMLPVAYGVAAAMISMAVVVIWADLVKPITLG